MVFSLRLPGFLGRRRLSLEPPVPWSVRRKRKDTKLHLPVLVSWISAAAFLVIGVVAVLSRRRNWRVSALLAFGLASAQGLLGLGASSHDEGLIRAGTYLWLAGALAMIGAVWAIARGRTRAPQ